MATSLTASILATRMVQSYVDRPGNPVENKPPLYDMLHNLFPNLCKYEKVIDVFPTLLGCIVVYYIIFEKMDHVKLCRIAALTHHVHPMHHGSGDSVTFSHLRAR